MSSRDHDAPAKTPEGSKTPRVSVAMCTFNGESYLGEQIDSILRQSSPVHEIIVADDASTDGTRRLLEEYKRRFPHLFQLCFHDSNVGTIENFQFALERCTGEIIFLCDQDDIWRSEKVATMLARLRDVRCLLLFTDGRLIDSTGKPLGSSVWKKWGFTRLRQFLWRRVPGAAARDLLYNNNKVTGATVAMRRTLLAQALPIRLPRGYWHDGWFAMHAAAQHGLAFIDDCLVDYRVHPKQQVGLQQNASPSNFSEIPFFEFRACFESQYPACARLIEALRFAAGVRAKLGLRR